jgi:hypothetical protein
MAGCKGLAVRDGDFCRKHSAASKEVKEEPEEADILTQYSKFLTMEERILVATSPEHPGLEAEIEVARVEVMRALQEGDDRAIREALVVVMRLVEAQRRLVGDQASGIVAAVTQIINELTGDKG